MKKAFFVVKKGLLQTHDGHMNCISIQMDCKVDFLSVKVSGFMFVFQTAQEKKRMVPKTMVILHGIQLNTTQWASLAWETHSTLSF